MIFFRLHKHSLADKIQAIDDSRANIYELNFEITELTCTINIKLFFHQFFLLAECKAKNKYWFSIDIYHFMCDPLKK